jgi:hypothetical protein
MHISTALTIVGWLRLCVSTLRFFGGWITPWASRSNSLRACELFLPTSAVQAPPSVRP